MLVPTCIAVVGAWLGFANPWLHVPGAVLGLPLGLAWLGFGAPSAGASFRRGWLAGMLALSGVVYWTALPVQQYGNLSWWLAGPCPVLIAMYLALYLGAFVVLLHLGAKRFAPWQLMLGGGVLWAAMEQLVAVAFSGFPWTSLSAALAAWPVAVQGAAVIGAYGLSGVLAAVGVGLALWPHSWTPRLLAVLLAAALGLFGWMRLQAPPPEGPEATVAMIQGNVDQSHKWDPANQAATVDTYTALTLDALQEEKADLVIWPETSMPFYFQDLTPLRSDVSALAAHADTPLLLGSPAYLLNAASGEYTLYNRAFLLDGAGHISAWYDKEHLVPFGEYVPLGRWLPIEKLVTAVGNFAPGEDQPPLRSGAMTLGPLICYEAIFPALAQQRVEAGANLLVNISNDAWFGDSSAPWQHLSLAAMRCVEQGRWMARCTNTGVTALIDPLGRVTTTGVQFEPLAVSGTVRLVEADTWFHAAHAWIHWGLYAAAALCLLALLLAPHRDEQRRIFT